MAEQHRIQTAQTRDRRGYPTATDEYFITPVGFVSLGAKLASFFSRLPTNAMTPEHRLMTTSCDASAPDYEARNHTPRQRFSARRAQEFERLAPAEPIAETISAGAASRSSRQRGQVSLIASRRRADTPDSPRWAQLSRVRAFRLNGTRIALCLCIGVLVGGCVPSQMTKDDRVTQTPNPLLNAAYSPDADDAFVMEPAKAVGRKSGKVNFASVSASRRTRDMAHWIVGSRDNLNLPFAIIDKVNAKVYVFSADGQLYGAAPVLLGLAKGDHAPPGVGDKPLSQIPPRDRITPAGRFVSTMGRNHKGKDILWLDYEQSLSMHAVVRGTARDRRAERLSSITPNDNRISFGCINVPTDFYRQNIKGKFMGAGGVVYILPESTRRG